MNSFLLKEFKKKQFFLKKLNQIHILVKNIALEKIYFDLKDRKVEAFYYKKDNKKRPGIVFLHDISGIVPNLQKTAELLMEEGFHVLLPNLYGEMGPSKYCVRMIFEEFARNNEAGGNEPLNEVLEILDHFKAFPEVDNNQLGMIGQCLTGGFILHAAIREEVKAPIVFHHSFGRNDSGFPAGCAGLVKNQIQGHYVYVDPFIPSHRLKKLEKQLGDKFEKNMYFLPHGIPHFFFNTSEGKKAFKKMVSFLKKSLKPS